MNRTLSAATRKASVRKRAILSTVSRLFTTGIYLLYRLCLTAAMPLITLYFLGRSLRQPAYFATLRERWGWLSFSYRQTGPGGIWLHAVSVGEVLSSLELIRRLRAERPSAPLFVSVGTLA